MPIYLLLPVDTFETSAYLITKASRTGANIFSSEGNLSQPFCATCRSPTQTVNLQRLPSINSGSILNSFLITAAARAALG
jgi:hypothetical protein